MGLGSIIAAGLKKVPWSSLAMNYGPELVRKMKGQIRQGEPAGDEDRERIAELERYALEQAAVIEQQRERILLLETSCIQAETKARQYRVATIILSVVAVILAIVAVTT